jgi:hypothetical protein
MDATAGRRRLILWLPAINRWHARNAAAPDFTETAYATYPMEQQHNVGYAETAATASAKEKHYKKI